MKYILSFLFSLTWWIYALVFFYIGYWIKIILLALIFLYDFKLRDFKDEQVTVLIPIPVTFKNLESVFKPSIYNCRLGFIYTEKFKPDKKEIKQFNNLFPDWSDIETPNN